MSGIPGSRGLHAATPAQRPPSESGPSSSRPTWTAAQPSLDNSALNSFLKARKAKESGSPTAPVGNLFKAAPEDMGKWAKSSPLFRPRPNAPPRLDGGIFSTPRTPRKQEQVPLESPFRNTQQYNNQETTTSPEEPRRKNPYADMLKSKKSTFDIENDLFAGITTDTTPNTAKRPDVKANANIMDSLFAKLDTEKHTEKSKGSYTKSSQPFKVSDSSIRNIMKSLQGKTAARPAEKPKHQFGFMSARQQPQATTEPQLSSSIRSATSRLSTTKMHPDLIQEAPEGMKRIDTSQWQSSSREKWTYEVDPQKEAEAEAERLLAADPKSRMTEEERELESEEQKEKMRELDKLIQRAKAAKFKVGMKEMGLWEHDKQRVEAPLEIVVQKNLYIPPSVSVSNFANLLKVPLGK